MKWLLSKEEICKAVCSVDHGVVGGECNDDADKGECVLYNCGLLSAKAQAEHIWARLNERCREHGPAVVDPDTGQRWPFAATKSMDCSYCLAEFEAEVKGD